MKRFLKYFTVAAMLASSTVTVCADDTVRVAVGDGGERGIVHIKPGAYLTTGAKQLRVTDKNGRVTMFKGQLPNGQASLTVLNEGDILEYEGVICMTVTGQDYKYDPFFTSAYVLAPLRYSPAKLPSFVRISDGSRTEIENGCVRIYSREDRLCEEFKSGYLDTLSGYILNSGYSAKDMQGSEKKTVLSLYEGVTYTVGYELEAGSYTGTGTGTVRVYNTAGNLKTVIKLSSGKADGVESYVFGFSDGETLITEGKIKLSKD